jgi:chaperonin GroEL (HSP60 family)
MPGLIVKLVAVGPLHEETAQAERLLDKGLHPIRISDGFERACQVAVKHLASVAEKFRCCFKRTFSSKYTPKNDG